MGLTVSKAGCDGEFAAVPPTQHGQELLRPGSVSIPVLTTVRTVKVGVVWGTVFPSLSLQRQSCCPGSGARCLCHTHAPRGGLSIAGINPEPQSDPAEYLEESTGLGGNQCPDPVESGCVGTSPVPCASVVTKVLPPIPPAPISTEWQEQ